MTQVCSLTSSTADVKACENKTLPKGIRIVGADEKSASKVKGMPIGEEDKAPWGYLFIQHYAAECFDRKLENTNLDGEFVPKCFIHRTLNYSFTTRRWNLHNKSAWSILEKSLEVR